MLKPGNESLIAIFYRSYATLRSIRPLQIGNPPGKRRVRVIAARFSTALPGYRAKKCLHRGQDILDDDIDALRRGMQTVRLIEPGVGSDALQEKRIQWHPERFRKVRIDRVEAGRIIAPVVRRRKHPAQ